MTMNEVTMNGDRVVLLDISEALYGAAEKLPRGSAWIDAFCGIAQLVEGGVGSRPLSARERLRRRGIQARACRARAPSDGQATPKALR
jgi:hypothetical protein